MMDRVNQWAQALLDEEEALRRAALRKLGPGLTLTDATKSLEELKAEELTEIRAERLEQDARTRAEARFVEARQRGMLHASPAVDRLPGRPGLASTRSRLDVLDPVIEQAQAHCRDPFSVAEVWPQLQALAEARQRPLIGVAEEGIKYTDSKDTVQFFRKSALKDRLLRRKKLLSQAR